MQRLLTLAAAVPPSSDPFSMLLQYGVLGIFAVLMIAYTRGSIAREREKSDLAEKQVKELNDYIRQDMLPKQVEATLLNKQVVDVLEETVKLISEMKIRDSILRETGVRRGRPLLVEHSEGDDSDGR